MKLACYIQPWRTPLPCTGVGRHINGVTAALAAREEPKLDCVAGLGWVVADRLRFAEHPLAHIPIRGLPWPQLSMERLWKAMHWPPADRWFSNVDFVFSPSEGYLPLRRTPWAMTLHDVQVFDRALPWSDGPEAERFRRRWGHWLFRALRDARLVFTVSQFSLERMVECLGADRSKLRVSGNGVDPRYFAVGARPKTDFARATEAPYAIAVGGLRYRKGGDLVVAVARELKRLGSPLRLAMVGQHEPRYDEAVRDLGNITLLGRIGDEELAGYVRAAEAVFFPSLYEGFGIPVLEGMAAGVPVVATKTASLPEVAGGHARLFAPDQTEGMADALHEIYRHPDAQRIAVDGGRAWARLHTWEACAGRVADAIRDSLASG